MPKKKRLSTGDATRRPLTFSIVGTVLVVFGAMSPGPSPDAQETAGFNQEPCTEDGFRAFDFWLGEWLVYNSTTGELTGENRITLSQNECALRESWQGTDGSSGGSTTYYNPLTTRWSYHWVSGSYGGYALNLEGSIGDDATMAMTGKGHFYQSRSTRTMRISWTLLDNGEIEQVFDNWSDDSESWETQFRGRYVGKKESGDD